MSEILFFYFTLYFSAVGAVVVLGFSIQKAKERSYIKASSSISRMDIVVLVPFRNEADRIEVLLNSIRKLESYPKEFIFIDDHSNDASAEIIQSSLGEIPFRILEMPSGRAGKKEALRFGIEQSVSRYILTWDADVEVKSNYFKELERLEHADMYVLPAVLEGKNGLQRFYEMDVILANAVNVGLAGLKRPVFASGANLLYARDSYLEVENYDTHKHLASGDDTYLLRDFRDARKDVRLISDANYSIRTETPQSLGEFIDQRLRWLGKTGNLNDHLATVTSLFQFLLSMAYAALLILALVNGGWKHFLLIYLLKTIVDIALFAPYFYRIQRFGSILLLPIYELLFLVYNLLLLLLLPFYKPKWKGRVIYTKKGPDLEP